MKTVFLRKPCLLRRTFVGLIFLTLAAVSAGAQVQFTDVTAAAGVDGGVYQSSNRHSLGVNWIDYDNDDWPDLFLVGGNSGNGPYLYHNDGDGTFTDTSDLLPTLPAVEMSGSIFADYDGDGDDDIFIYTDNPDLDIFGSNEPDGPLNLLLKNMWVENGAAVVVDEPLFAQAAASAGVQGAAETPFGSLPGYRSKTAGWVDYDRDGCIDLYVGHWVHNEGGDEANRDLFYRNLCDGTFENVTAASGINPGDDSTTYRAALAMIAAHLDNDLWPDIYVAHTGEDEVVPYTDDFLYRNNGPDEEGEVTFTEVSTTMTGVGDDNAAGMGIDVADIDLDGDWDLYISDAIGQRPTEATPGNVLYLGNADGSFADTSAIADGVQGRSSWGVNFFDADQDGYEDLYISVLGSSGVDVFFLNDGDGTFTDLGEDSGFDTYDSRGSAVADYDRDGDLDLAVVDQRIVGNLPGVLRLFRNDTVGLGGWLQLKLVSNRSNPDAIGAVVKVQIGEMNLMRQIKGGSSAHSQDSLVVHFGLGDATQVDQLQVLWPSGKETLLTNVAVNQLLSIVEPNLAPVAVADGPYIMDDTTLTVAAPGVLGNDTDGENDTLTAMVVDPPMGSAFSLLANGSFSYTPLPDFTGEVSFSYRAYDGRDNSQTLVVPIIVTEQPFFSDGFESGNTSAWAN